MYRIIIILVLLIILFFMVRKAFREYWGPKRGDPALPAKDVMVQDPVCKTYIPQRNSLHVRRDNQVIYFCSEQCRDRYLEDHPD